MTLAEQRAEEQELPFSQFHMSNVKVEILRIMINTFK